MQVITKQIDLGDGRSISIETGKLAKQADGSVVVRLDDTMLLATVVANKDIQEGVDFLPLTVDYREKFASAGKIPGGFFKREARPSTEEILTMRLVDRALRPLFPDDFHAETQVMISLISSDKKNLPDALACLAASAAIAVSDIPFNGPVSEVRVARTDGEFIINPTIEQLANADIDLMVAGTIDNIVMVEGEMNEVSEEEMVEAIAKAHDAIKIQCKGQMELAEMAGKANVVRDYTKEPVDEDLAKKIWDATYQKFYDVAKTGTGKEERSEKFAEIAQSFIDTLSDEEKENNAFLINKYLNKAKKEAVRKLILDEGIRLDGRKTNEIRPIWCEVDYLPGCHGSSIFTRGETQSLTSLTLGSKLDEQTIDGAVLSGNEKFMLHYNFPPFSTGEARPIRGTSRREIGHGNLALRALKPMIPKEFPYTIRLVSDILESNGSSSMATVCAGTLALMDGGVQIKKPVSGIAMGLITDKDGKYAILSDILGDEDHLGDMDFKVTGTKDGITACQMDIKVDGLTFDILTKALHQAKEGRLHILNEMLKTISEPNKDFKPHVPRIEMIVIPKDTIGTVIGPGGKMIQGIQAETGTTITIEEVGDFGHVHIMADDKEAMEIAKNKINLLVAVPEVGEIYEGKVKTITNFGAFIEILPGKEGLLHISEIDWKRLDKVEDALKEGEMVKVKLIGFDKGKMKLSRKVLLPKPERKEA